MHVDHIRADPLGDFGLVFDLGERVPGHMPFRRAQDHELVGMKGDSGVGAASQLSAASIGLDDLFAEQLGVDKEKITPETSFVNDLGADSLDTVELVMELEEEFDINIPDDEAEKIQTVGEAIEFIEKTQDS